MKKINFRQPKYIIPTIAYFGLLLVGYLVIDIFNVEIGHKEDDGLKTTEYLNSDLPEANIAQDIGSKRKNMRESYGGISDFSSIQDFAENPDTLNRKEEFESKYSDEELAQLQEQQRQQEEIRRLQELNEKLAASARKGDSLSRAGRVQPLTEEELARAREERRSQLLANLERDLGNTRAEGVAAVRDAAFVQDSIRKVLASADEPSDHAVHALDDDAEDHVVTKASIGKSDYFNTLSDNESSSDLILAIVDEDIKAVDGSRIRLRLIDPIDIDGVLLPKGTYLYATLGGFGKQRVKGSVQSVLVDDKIMKINLSIYDVGDGLEGLYVPESQFSETAKDIGSSVTQGNMNMNSGYGGSSVSQWAGQALQNAYQRTSQAISKAIKKNRVKVKYGTQVYLVNGKNSDRQ